ALSDDPRRHAVLRPVARSHDPEVELAVEPDAAPLGTVHGAPLALELDGVPVTPVEANPVVRVVHLLVLRPAKHPGLELNLPERDLAAVLILLEPHATD